MKTYIHLTMSQNYCLPDVFQGDDVRYPESLVEFFLEQFTQKGYVVFDPFAGYGTTLLVAERMGRVPFGVEINQDRVNFARSKLSNPENLIHGDARVLANIDLPEDVAMTTVIASSSLHNECAQQSVQRMAGAYGILGLYLRPSEIHVQNQYLVSPPPA